MSRQLRARGLLVAVVLVASACSSAAAPAPSAPASAAAASVAPSVRPDASGRPPSAGAPEALGDRLVATITVDTRPCAIAFDSTAAWVTSYTLGTVDRVDLATNAVTGRAKIGGSPCGIAVGADGRLWVADLAGLRVVAIDPATLAVTATIGSLGADLWDLKAGFGSIWVVDRDHEVVLRIDPKTAKVAQRIAIGPNGSGLAVTTHSVWVADGTDGTIRRIDPATNKAVVTATLQGGAVWFADDGESRLAVAGTTGGPVAVLDPDSGVIRTTGTGWLAPRDGTVVGTTAWIPDGKAQAVRLMDVESGKLIASYALPGSANPFVAEPGAGDLFILDFAGTTIWRIRP